MAFILLQMQYMIYAAERMPQGERNGAVRLRKTGHIGTRELEKRLNRSRQEVMPMSMEAMMSTRGRPLLQPR